MNVELFILYITLARLHVTGEYKATDAVMPPALLSILFIHVATINDERLTIMLAMRDAGLGVKGLCEPQYHTETCRLHWLLQGFLSASRYVARIA